VDWLDTVLELLGGLGVRGRWCVSRSNIVSDNVIATFREDTGSRLE
jgi:hypothetical protein